MEFISRIANDVLSAHRQVNGDGKSWLNSVRLSLNHEGRGYIVLLFSGHNSASDSGPGIAATTYVTKAPILIAYSCKKHEEAEREMILAAWEMGAWDLSRMERPPKETGSGVPSEGIRAHFGGDYYSIPGVTDMQTPDSDVLRVAAKKGYVTWFFRPTFESPRVSTNDDTTLTEDGRRSGTPHIALLPFNLSGKRQTIYDMGRKAEAPF